MAPVTVEITARAIDEGARIAAIAGIGDADDSPVTFECRLAPAETQSHGEAIVHALRKSADTAATRLGIIGDGERLVPPAVARVIDELCAAADQDTPASPERQRAWARVLGAEYGLILTADAERLGETGWDASHGA